MNRPLVIILGTVILDSVGIGLIFPIMPQLLRDVTHMGEVAPLFGVMIALYALMQFLFSPVLGAISDRFGRRPVLLVSLAGAAIDYLVMAFTPYLWLLFLGRAIAGVTAANMTVATAYITDITPEDQRAGRFGYIHAMFGIGFLVGPLLGGVLGEVWVRAPFLAAAFLNLLNFLLALFVLPESHKGERTAVSPGALNPFRLLKWGITVRALVPFLFIFFILNFVGQVYGTVWVLYGEDVFHWSPLVIGMSLAAYGLLHALVQGFLPGPMVRVMGERKAFLFGAGAEVAALTILGFITDGWVVFALLPLFSLGGVGTPALQSLATRSVSSEHQGRLQGVLNSLMSLASIFGPLFFASIYTGLSGGWSGGIWFVAAFVYLGVFPLVLLQDLQKRSL